MTWNFKEELHSTIESATQKVLVDLPRDIAAISNVKVAARFKFLIQHFKLCTRI